MVSVQKAVIQPLYDRKIIHRPIIRRDGETTLNTRPYEDDFVEGRLLTEIHVRADDGFLVRPCWMELRKRRTIHSHVRRGQLENLGTSNDGQSKGEHYREETRLTSLRYLRSSVSLGCAMTRGMTQQKYHVLRIRDLSVIG